MSNLHVVVLERFHKPVENFPGSPSDALAMAHGMVKAARGGVLDGVSALYLLDAEGALVAKSPYFYNMRRPKLIMPRHR